MKKLKGISTNHYSITFGVTIKISESTESQSKICCTWQDETVCINCQEKTKLDCRWERKLLLRFMYFIMPAFIFGIGGIIFGALFTGMWWRLGAIAAYFAIFFIVETRILCSHCPYYSEEGKILHCLANHGFFKFAKYHPEPMNLFERILLVIGFLIFIIIFPLAQLYDLLFVITNLSSFDMYVLITISVLFGLSTISILTGFILLFTKICPYCVNFSCPWNKVPKEVVDAYLEKNIVMKEAWEKQKKKK